MGLPGECPSGREGPSRLRGLLQRRRARREAGSRSSTTIRIATIAVLLLLTLPVVSAELGVLVEAPWAIEAFGPTLTGTWEGPLQARRSARGHAHAQPVRPGPVYGPERPTSSKDRMTRSGQPS
jgi:hypothetical protein